MKRGDDRDAEVEVEETEASTGERDDAPTTTGEGGRDDAGEEAASSNPDDGSGTAESVTRAEYDELNDRHLRLAAEFNNFRRRVEADALGTWSRAQADLLGDFLDVLDDLTRVAGLDPGDEKVSVQAIVEGIDLVEQKFVKTLADAGTEVIAPEEGDTFDPEMMEAMMRVPTDDASLDDAVAHLFQRGYRLGGTLVRPARVSVFKAE
ncbi:MAG: nucleotide exchange factor GrpE [Longimicrobiales bacterium]|nr:nucleotide exchange factor GrpE [Longimicrobiales bacterium]